MNSEQPADEEDLSEYTFRKYAATYFAHGTGHQHSRKPPRAALHDLPTPDDVLAAQALWATVLRFMGDMSEPRGKYYKLAVIFNAILKICKRAAFCNIFS